MQPQAEAIAAAVDVAPAGLLRRHEIDRADRVACDGGEGGLLAGVDEGTEAQVQNLDLAVVRQEQVRGLDVPVDDPVDVGVRRPRAAWAA